MSKQVPGIGNVNRMQYNHKGRDHVSVMAPNTTELTRESVYATAKAHVQSWTECILFSSTGQILDAMDNTDEEVVSQ